MAQAHGSGHHDDHGIAHVASARSMLTTFGLLMVFTVLTVAATKVDFGPKVNLALAMAIAVIKATLVILFFMHLAYDKLFHSVLLVGAVLAGALFVGFTLMDSSQYQHSLHWNPREPVAAPDGPRFSPFKP